ncbi:MAG: hypothetical protein HC882_05265 [Acidobacteria bacterium]|nr:hypothetical protein [Acidobacteriota bacterium]
MRARIAKYRSRPLVVGEDPVIGCLMITQPVFFPDASWVAQPRDWPKNVVAGKRYDLQKDEGQRIWRACLTNAPVALVDATTAIPAAAAAPGAAIPPPQSPPPGRRSARRSRG